MVKFDIKDIDIYGFDKDPTAIKICEENHANLIEKSFGSDNKKEKPQNVNLAFKSKNIQSLVENLNFSSSDSSVILIITQPPYGFTIKKTQVELGSLYNNLIDLAHRMAGQNMVLMSLIVGNDKIFENATMNSAYPNDLLYPLMNKQKIKKKGKRHFLYSFIM
jgi:23S rRNA G2445 N2-methylase RlmL